VNSTCLSLYFFFSLLDFSILFGCACSICGGGWAATLAPPHTQQAAKGSGSPRYGCHGLGRLFADVGWDHCTVCRYVVYLGFAYTCLPRSCLLVHYIPLFPCIHAIWIQQPAGSAYSVLLAHADALVAWMFFTAFTTATTITPAKRYTYRVCGFTFCWHGRSALPSSFGFTYHFIALPVPCSYNNYLVLVSSSPSGYLLYLLVLQNPALPRNVLQTVAACRQQRYRTCTPLPLRTAPDRLRTALFLQLPVSLYVTFWCNRRPARW